WVESAVGALARLIGRVQATCCDFGERGRVGGRPTLPRAPCPEGGRPSRCWRTDGGPLPDLEPDQASRRLPRPGGPVRAAAADRMTRLYDLCQLGDLLAKECPQLRVCLVGYFLRQEVAAWQCLAGDVGRTLSPCFKDVVESVHRTLAGP